MKILEYGNPSNDKIILIDYKTNKTKNANKLKETYYMQLNLYKMAAELSFKKEIISGKSSGWDYYANSPAFCSFYF